MSIFNRYLQFGGSFLLLTVCSASSQPESLAPTETRHTQDTTREKITGQRIMQTFDFEEREVNYLNLPMYWQKVMGSSRDGFPHYSEGRLERERARSGQYSFKLIPDGGSVGFTYDRRRIRIKPGSDFQVTEVSVGIEEATAGSGGSQPAELRLHTLSGGTIDGGGTLSLLDSEAVRNRLWIVEDGRIRVRG